MTMRSSSTCPSFAFYDKLSRKPLLFKSFTGLVVKEFDNTYNKKYRSKRKDIRERKAGAIGRPFKLDVKDRFLMLFGLLSSLRHLRASWFFI